MSRPHAPLPVDEALGDVVAALAKHRAVVVVAPPGAGKTTRVPPALAADGPVIVLQPRRIAARALARRIAEERGWEVGREVGWQVRFERRFAPDTRVLVATEGILAARLRGDPLLADFRTVVLDEFHERSLHADLALALARQAWLARDDLRLVVMSATLDARPVAAFLGAAPVIEVPARRHAVEVAHAPDTSVSAAARQLLARAGGHVLAFLPGAREIGRALDELRTLPPGVRVLPLHGSLGAEAQDRALEPCPERKLILATNIAETSLTVEGVSDVIDSGYERVLRYDARLGIERLELERVARDSAEQRAGRAGRTGPGRALRLWDPRIELDAAREPEIRRADLAGTLLEVFAHDADPRRFEWFEAPPAELRDAALATLERLGATAGGRITELGRTLRSLPLDPRLARLLVAAGASDEAAALCAMLADGAQRLGPRDDSTAWDALALVTQLDAHDGWRESARRLREIARRIEPTAPGEHGLRGAILAAYPDRVARRREPGSPRVLLRSGHGAVLPAAGGVEDSDWLVVIDVAAGERGPRSEARVRIASPIEPAWLEPDRREIVHELDAGTETVRARERSYVGAIALAERPVDPDPAAAAELLARRLLERGLGPANDALLARSRFAGLEIDVEDIIRRACAGKTRLPTVDLHDLLSPSDRRNLERLAPASLVLPGGRRARLDYRGEDRVFAAVKLQDAFGLEATPRVGPHGVPVTFELLAPSGRPVQTTTDLASFWSNGYAEVRKELRARYPKHAWPEDPRAAGAARPRRR